MLAEVWDKLGGCCAVPLLLIILLITWYVWTRLTSNLPPGPSAISNYFMFKKNKEVAEYEVIRRLKPKYGDVITIYMGPTPVITLNSFEAVKQAFVEQGNEFAGRPFSIFGELFSEGNNNVLTSDFGPRWLLHRRLVMVALKKFGDKNTIMNLICDATNDSCEMMLKETETHGRVRDMKKEVYWLIYNVIAVLVFGKRFSEDDKDFNMLIKNADIINESFGQGFLADLIPWFKHVPTPATRRLKKTMDDCFVFFNKNIEEHKQSLDENNPRDICDNILITRAEMEREGKEDMSLFTDLHVKHSLVDILFAGTDATCFTIQWCVLFSVYYPEEQERVFKEIDAKVGTRVITVDDRRELHHTEAFVLESMRSRPIAPLAVAHTTTQPTTKLYGYDIKRGINVLPNLWACHHDDKYWEDPDEFRPTRFIDPKTGRANIKPDSFLAFSIGKRGCAGEHLGRLNTFLIFATLIQKMKFINADQGLSREEALKPDVAWGPFVCIPKGVDVKTERR